MLNDWADNNPVSNLALVPELPKYIFFFDCDNELSPFPWIKILLFSFVIFTPSDLKASIVCVTSSDINILFISDMPFEIDGIIIDLCEIDLSPGISIFPFKPSLILFDIFFLYN